MSTLSHRIRERLDALEMPVAVLARACGVKAPSVHGWLSGKSKFLRGENLLRAAAALDVSNEWLATGLGPRQRDPADQPPAPVLTQDEIALLAIYRRGDPPTQTIIRKQAEQAITLTILRPKVSCAQLSVT